jgi:hypothetical protein
VVVTIANVSEEAREERKLKENQIVEKSTTIASIAADVLGTSVAHEKQGQNENQIVEGSATALIAAGVAGTTMMAQEARDSKLETEIAQKSAIRATEDPMGRGLIGSEIERPSSSAKIGKAGVVGTSTEGVTASKEAHEKNEIEIAQKSTIQATEGPGTVIGSEVERPSPTAKIGTADGVGTMMAQEAPPEIKQVFEMRDLRQYVVCEAQCKDPPWAKYSEVESAHGVRAAKMIQDVVDRHCSQISRSGPKFASLPLGRRGTRNQ